MRREQRVGGKGCVRQFGLWRELNKKKVFLKNNIWIQIGKNEWIYVIIASYILLIFEAKTTSGHLRKFGELGNIKKSTFESGCPTIWNSRKLPICCLLHPFQYIDFNFGGILAFTSPISSENMAWS